MTRSLTAQRLSDPAMSADEQEWYALGFEAALRGESDLRDSDDEPTAKQDAAWNRGHADATREESTPALRAFLLHREDSQLQQPTTLEMAVARKVAKRAEVAERDAAARERIANALERLCALVEELP